MARVTIMVTAEQASIIRDWTLEPVRRKVDVQDLDGEDWREYYGRLRDAPRPRPAHLSEEDWEKRGEQVRQHIDDTMSLLEQLEAQQDTTEVTLTMPREHLEGIACGIANVTIEHDRREIRAGLDLLDQLDAIGSR